jgi:hypothetical protein
MEAIKQEELGTLGFHILTFGPGFAAARNKPVQVVLVYRTVA